MSHYEERLEKDLATIRGRVVAVASRIERAVADAVTAVLNLDRKLAYATVLGDLPINREIREIDRICHAFVARHLPSAGHLRFVSSVLRLNVALERVGDYAVAISREAAQLSKAPPSTVARDIDLLSDQNRRMLTQAMQAFEEANAEMARGTMGLSGQLNATFERVYDDLLKAGEAGKRPTKDLFALLVVFNRLGRVGDQAKNVCEETIFSVTGESKQPKVYRILFIDARNDRASLLAEAYARKAFPESGQYDSAGWDPAKEIDPDCREFMEQRGYDLGNSHPSRLDASHEHLNDYHLVVSLEGDPRAHLGEIPFHTILLEWELDADTAGQPGLNALREQIAVHVSELMETLRGEGAA